LYSEKIKNWVWKIYYRRIYFININNLYNIFFENSKVELIIKYLKWLVKEELKFYMNNCKANTHLEENKNEIKDINN